VWELCNLDLLLKMKIGVLVKIDELCQNEFSWLGIIRMNQLLEQNVFNFATLCFDDNNVLKVQLDMLIFVQVWRNKH